jgi:hypothetical protein
MPGLFMRIGQILFVLGFVYYFFRHQVIATAIIAGFGFIVFVIGVILWSLESPGDMNFS